MVDNLNTDNRSPLAYLALVGGIIALSFSALFVRWAQAPGLVTSCLPDADCKCFFIPIFLKTIKTGEKIIIALVVLASHWWAVHSLGPRVLEYLD